MNEEKILEYADKIILEDDLASYESSFGDVRDGYFKRYVFENGDECVVYYPETITNSTKVSTYYPGSGFKADWYSANHGSGNVGIQDYLMSSGCDQIIVMPHSSTNASRDYIGAKVTTMMTEEYGLSTNASWSGFSMGATPSIESAVTYMNLNPDCEPQVVIQIDGYSGYYSSPSYTANGIAEDFKNTGSILVALDAKGKSNYLDYYAKAGINVIKVVSSTNGYLDVNCGSGVKQENRGGQHVQINQDFFKDGFLQFNAADGSPLPSDGYAYYAWDSTNNSWYEIDVSQIDTYEKLNDFFGNKVSGTSVISMRTLKKLATLADLKIESNDKTLETSLNTIRSAIRNTKFLQGNFSSTSFSSTTKVPSSIPNLVSQFFSTNTTLLELLAEDTLQFAKIGSSIVELDQQTAQEAEELDNSLNLNSILNNNNSTTSTNNNLTTNALNGALIGVGTALNTQNNNTNNNNQSTSSNTSPNNNTSSNADHSTNSSNQNNSSSKNQSSTNSTNSSSNNKPTNNQSSENTTPEEPTGGIETFYDYETLCSDETKIVYNCNDEYKVIIHKDGENVIGIEYYYDYGTEDSALANLESLKQEYSSVEYFDEVIQKDQYVKVLFKEEMYKDLSLNEIREKFSTLEEIIKL